MCQQNGRSWLFRQKKLGPTLGAVYRKWKIKNHVQDPKIDQRSVNNSKKGYKRNTPITNNQNHPQNNLYWEWKKMVRIHYYGVLDKICALSPKTVITFANLLYCCQLRKGFLLANRWTLILHVAFSLWMCTKTSVESIISMQTRLLFLCMMKKP